MKETENLTAESEEKKPQTGVDLLGLATVRMAKEGDFLKVSYLPIISDDGDSAYLGVQTAGVYYLELWFEEGVLAEAGLDVVVLSKTFYNNKRNQKDPGVKNDIRRTGGEFQKKDCREEVSGGKTFKVYSQQFKIAPKNGVSGRLVAAENDNNLYVVLASTAGILTYTMSAFFDQKHANGLYLVVEDNWTGPVGKVDGNFACYTLERKRLGSPALFEVMKEHYAPKMGELENKKVVISREKEESLNVSGLRAWGCDENLLAQGVPPTEAQEIEVFCYGVSGPRTLSFGRDRWGRQIYLNWDNVIGVPVPQIRRVQKGTLVRCKFRVEPHTNFKREKIELVRGLDIQILPEAEAKARIDLLARLGGEWVEWQDWFNDPKVEDQEEVKSRAKNFHRSGDRSRKHRKLLGKPLWRGVPGAFGRENSI